MSTEDKSCYSITWHIKPIDGRVEDAPNEFFSERQAKEAMAADPEKWPKSLFEVVEVKKYF